MPNIKSAKKRVLVAKKKAAQNKASHILHKNNAAHKKSALMKKLAASAN